MRNLKRFIKPAFVLPFLFLSLSSSAGTSFKVSSGEVEFFGMGKPSQLKIHGESKVLSGSLTPAENSYSGEFKASLATFETGMKLRDNHLKDKIFEFEKYPEASFTLSSVVLSSSLPVDAKDLPFKGRLKFHGVEKDVQGSVAMKASDKDMEFTAEFEIKLTEFGITPPEFMGITVQDQVKIKVHGKAQ